MREILFRGKLVDNGGWVEGDLTGGYVIHTKPPWAEGSSFEWWGYQVIPESVGQFTGLTDKNGKKIFEGDILNDGDRPWSVKQLSGGCWALDYANGSGEKYLYPINKHIEIIGNMHDK